MKIYGVGRQLLAGIKAFYKEASACVTVDGEVSESSYTSGSETRMYDVAMTV